MINKSLLTIAIQQRFKQTLVLLPLIATVPTFASAEGTNESFGLEEVVVTARKMTESLQDTPVAVTAYSGDMLESKGMVDLTNVADTTPNVNIRAEGGISGGNAAARVFIRGVGQNDFIISGDPGVGVYIDGVYYARTVGSAMDLVDLEQVEILRGPQGTLFGRNTIGGAINLNSKAPEFDSFNGKVSASLGEVGFRSLSGSINIPFTDNLASRASILRRQRDGYVDALQYDGLKLGDEDLLSVRIRTLWQVSDNLDVDLNLDYSEDNTNGSGEVATAFNPNATFIRGGNLVAGGDCATADGPQTDPSCIGPVQLTDDNYSTNNTWYDIDGNKIKPFSLFENSGASLTISWAINDDLEFKSISAYRELESSFIRSWSHSPAMSFQNTTDAYMSEQISQEFQLNGTSLGGDLRWVSGLYYFEEDGFESDTVAFAVPIPPAGLVIARPNDNFTVENSTLAVFGQGTYDFSESLHLTLGLRYTEEEKNGGTEATLNTGERVFFSIEPIEKTNVTPYVSVSYDINDDIMTYASFSQGFKSGTFSTRTPSPEFYLNADGTPGTLPTAEQEEVDAFELGLKSELFDGRLRSNIALFRTEYTDIQIPVPAPANNSIFINGGDGVLQGLEAEITYLATEDLQLTAGIGLLDAEYESLNPGVPIFLDTEFYGTPDYTVSLGAEYTFIMDTGNLTVNLDWNFVDNNVLDTLSKTRSVADENLIVIRDNIQQEAYDFGNLSFVYQPHHDEWSLSLMINNLSDAEYRVGAQDNSTDPGQGFGISQAHFNRPREVRAGFNYYF